MNKGQKHIPEGVCPDCGKETFKGTIINGKPAWIDEPCDDCFMPEEGAEE